MSFLTWNQPTTTKFKTKIKIKIQAGIEILEHNVIMTNSTGQTK